MLLKIIIKALRTNERTNEVRISQIKTNSQRQFKQNRVGEKNGK